MSFPPFAPAGATTDVYSVEEIARAARVSPGQITDLIGAGRVLAFRGFVAATDAARLVRELARGTATEELERAPITLLAGGRRRATLPLFASGTLHALLLLMLIAAATYGLLTPSSPPFVMPPAEPARLVSR